MSSARFLSTEHADDAAEAELNALATIYRRAIARYEQAKAAGCDQHRDGDEAKGSKYEDRPNGSIHQ